MKIAVIDNFDSFVYNLVRYLEEIPAVEIIVQRNNAINYAILESCDALLLSPGPGIPSEAGDLMNIIAEFHQQLPILGVCLGHQAIAEFFGGKLIPSAVPIHGKSSKIHPSNSSDLFTEMTFPLQVGRYHSWLVSSEIPDCLRATTELITGEIMGIRHADFPVEGIQFHPESILTPNGRSMINNWVKSLEK